MKCSFQKNFYQSLIRIAGCVIAMSMITSITTDVHARSESETIIHDNCRECHGADGKAKTESWPNLSCQNRGYLYSRLLSLQNENDHDIDKRVKELSIMEIDDISKYYSKLKCTRP